ncbi:MAG: hypothetical protein M5U07_16665 [Xanthobacteraceae bacterium]|nr:hypothetical protein [Xanthobacteraceae bacterium]
MSETGTHAYTIGHASAVAPEALIAMGAGLDLRYAMILTPDAYQLARIEGATCWSQRERRRAS